MRNHSAEKDRIEPGEWAVEAGDPAPADGEENVAGVVDFAGVGVCYSALAETRSLLWIFLRKGFRGRTYTIHQQGCPYPFPSLWFLGS